MLLLLLACASGADDTGAGLPLTLRFEHQVDGQPAALSSDQPHTSGTGTPYGLSRLSWVVARPSLMTAEGDRWTLDAAWYVDLASPETRSWTIQVDPQVVLDHHCVCLDLSIGLPAEHAALPVQGAPADMDWPDSLGGGTHNLRLEGQQGTDATPFALHTGPLGGADNAVALTLDLDAVQLTAAGTEITVQMDVARWLVDPHEIDLAQVPGGGIMDREDWQTLLRDNGHDVLSVTAVTQP